MPSIKYLYFVSFWYNDKCFTNAQAVHDNKIKTIEDTNAIQASLAKQFDYENVVIANYTLLGRFISFD